MPITVTVTQTGNKDFYYTEEFKTLVRSEKEYFFNNATEESYLVPAIVYAFRYDFYRILRESSVPQYLWWATAFINDVNDPFQDMSGLKKFYRIDEQLLEAAIARKNTVRG